MASLVVQFGVTSTVTQTQPCHVSGVALPIATLTVTAQDGTVSQTQIQESELYGPSGNCGGTHSVSKTVQIMGAPGRRTINYTSDASWARFGPSAANPGGINIIHVAQLAAVGDGATVVNQNWTPTDPGPPPANPAQGVSSGGPIASTVLADYEPDPLTPPQPPTNATSSAGGVIVGSVGGQLSTPDVSITIPTGVVSGSRGYRLSAIPSGPFSPPSGSDVPDGPALLLQTSPAPTVGPLAPHPALAGDVQLTFNIPSGLPATDVPLVQVIAFDGSNLPLSFPTVRNATSMTASIPSSIFAQAKTLAVYDVKYTGPADPAAGLRLLVGPTWTNNAAGIDPSKHTLLLVHGIFSEVDKAFPGPVAQRMGSEGGYDQVIGYTYAWWQPPSVVGPQLAQAVSGLGLKLPLDVVAHSYGGIVSMAAAPNMGVSIDNFVTLGSPIEGSPFLTQNILQTIGANLPSREGSLGHVGDAASNGMLASISPNSATLTNLWATFNALHVTRVIKVGGTTPYTFEQLLFSNYYTSVTGNPISGTFDGVVTTASATSSQTTGSASANPFAVHAPPLTQSISVPYTHTELDNTAAVESQYIPLMFYALSSDPVFKIKGNGAYSIAWWIDEDGQQTTISTAPSNAAIVTVVPSQQQTIGSPNQPPPGTLPPQYVKITGGPTSGQATIQVTDSDPNNHRLTKTVTHLPDCASCAN
jgi:pimeloyl-ACP methyl ester carboxylesterase